MLRGGKPGRPPIWTRRQLTDGIRWRTRTGTPWRDVPERYGPGEREGELQKESPRGTGTEPDDHGLGRSRGGPTTKLHLAVEQGQKPMSIVIIAGQRGDSQQFEPVLENIRVPRIGPGHSRKRP
ncbi:transposase [Streptomyces sp. NPDC005279]|uniref:transposase n=1 Tax=Streptomyces sp. NPDC005279 TaxID=3364712 RepID=UPI003681FD04